jgi:hypothetical protein
MGNGAYATNDFTFVWSDGTAIGSTAEKQFSAYASSGYRLLGGPITGNGSGLTGVTYATSSGIASNLHSGNATTGQVATANGSGGTFWATPAAGGAATPATNSILLGALDWRAASSSDYISGATGWNSLNAYSSGVADSFAALLNSATNKYTGTLYFKFSVPSTVTNPITQLRVGFANYLCSTNLYSFTLATSNSLNGALSQTWTMTITNTGVKVTTNLLATGTVLTNLNGGQVWWGQLSGNFGCTSNGATAGVGISEELEVIQ